jgi:hypothetical protein
VSGPAASLTFLTPAGALVALAVLLPLGGLILAGRRIRAARALLGLAAPPAGGALVTGLALLAVPVLLGVAAAQPALRTLEEARVRTDAEVFFVLDSSRSMAAAQERGAPTRLRRARAAALRLRAALDGVPTGVATLTDRVLPHLFPTPDDAAFDATVREAVGIERPPPQTVEVVATTLAPLVDLATQGYFAPTARRRLVVLLTDGESQPYEAAAVARALESGPGVSLVSVHVWGAGERVFGPSGRPEAAYRADPRSGPELDRLAAATGGRAFDEDELDAAAGAARRALGEGPTAARGVRPETTALAPYVAGLAFIPLLVVLVLRNLGPRLGAFLLRPAATSRLDPLARTPASTRNA